MYSELFISLFNNTKKIEKGETFIDDVYTQAHDEFMKNAKVIEEKYPSVTEGYEDDEKWYDEYHDDIVSDYMKKIIEFSE